MIDHRILENKALLPDRLAEALRKRELERKLRAAGWSWSKARAEVARLEREQRGRPA